MVLDEIWLPGAMFRGLTLEQLSEYKWAPRAMFKTDFSTRIVRASEKIRAISVNAVVAKLLGIQAAYPLLSIDRVSYTYGNRPIEVRQGWYVTSKYFYQNDLS